MPQPLRIRKPLHHQYGATLGPADPVGRARIGFAAPVRRQPAMPTELHEDRRGGIDGGTAGQRQITLTGPQRLHRHMQRHQRRRTRRIHRHRHRRALQPQHISHPTRSHAGGHARQAVALDLLGEHAVALDDQSGEHTGGAAAQAGRIDAGALQCLPGQLQQHPVLRVHRQRLTGGDTEKAGIEVGHAVDEAAGARVGLVRRVRIRVE
ncbi:hypothetical protein DSM43519_01866 [Mycobacterium marinum]|nr:hypothetical protein DSM43519_01866 [Mycobacterium marinum]